MHVLRTKTRVLFVLKSLKYETPLVFSILGSLIERAWCAAVARDLEGAGVFAPARGTRGQVRVPAVLPRSADACARRGAVDHTRHPSIRLLGLHG